MTRLVPSAFEPSGERPSPQRSPRLRLWSVRHSGLIERFYARFEVALTRAAPMLAFLGYDRLERPAAALDATIKGLLFDCRMCGDCVLSNTGMSCPMNCPKGMRNGPCGGVRADGNCEVHPQMPCVWVKAWEGSRSMQGGDAIAKILPPLDHTRRGSSTWLRLARETERE